MTRKVTTHRNLSNRLASSRRDVRYRHVVMLGTCRSFGISRSTGLSLHSSPIARVSMLLTFEEVESDSWALTRAFRGYIMDRTNRGSADE